MKKMHVKWNEIVTGIKPTSNLQTTIHAAKERTDKMQNNHRNASLVK